MRRLLGLISLVLLAGCSRVTVDAEVKADGSMHRSLTFGGGGGPNLSMLDKSKPGAANAWEKGFVLPKGAGWTVKRGNDPSFQDPFYTATRDVPVGTPYDGDITLVDSNGKKDVTNQGHVTARGDGTFEYSETFHWVGPHNESSFSDADSRAKIKVALPPGSDTAKIDAVTTAATKAVLRTLFGPGDPAMDKLFTHREFAYRRIKIAVRGAVRPLVADDAAADRVVAVVTDFSSGRANSQPPNGLGSSPDSMSSGLVSVLYFVRFPGQVLETNGLREDDGSVSWRFYSEAAEVEDVTLRAVFKP